MVATRPEAADDDDEEDEDDDDDADGPMLEINQDANRANNEGDGDNNDEYDEANGDGHDIDSQELDIEQQINQSQNEQQQFNHSQPTDAAQPSLASLAALGQQQLQAPSSLSSSLPKFIIGERDTEQMGAAGALASIADAINQAKCQMMQMKPATETA